jgi:hypothetical protein
MHWLGVLPAVRSGGRIAGMSDPDVTVETGQRGFVEKPQRRGPCPLKRSRFRRRWWPSRPIPGHDAGERTARNR